VKIEFHKTGERRYAVKILRENLPDLEMNPAPGFDDLMPHDLCHLIVEQVLQIESAIFGQLTKNGTAGTFRNAPSNSKNTKNDSRQQRKSARKGKKMVKENLEDYAKSERATYICWQNWLENSADEKLKKRAAEMKENAESIINQMLANEKSGYTKETLAKVRERMSELSEKWQNLKSGEFMTVNW
jgi:NADH dehydrogenase/NADH:ubiquinone oxidoreductase subunit G